MPIPINIFREHVFQAMLKTKREGIPKRHNLRKWGLQYENEIYPCKLLISWGNFYANGEELDYNPNNFQAQMANKYLANLGFEIIEL